MNKKNTNSASRLSSIQKDVFQTHRGVFAKLAEGREGFLMGLTDLFNDGLQLGCQLVVLCQLRLWALLLLLISVISNS